MSNLDKIAEWSTNLVDHSGSKYYWQPEGSSTKLCNKQLALWYEQEYNCWTNFISTEHTNIQRNLSNAVIDMDKNYTAEYLHKIREQYDYVQLLFSGGGDSVTIFDEIVTNKIYIDEVISCYVDNLDYQCNQEIKNNAIPYAEKHKDYYGKFSLVNNSFNLLSSLFEDPYGLFKLPVGMSAPLNIGRVFTALHNREKIPNSCYIRGADKPQLIHYKNSWYATFTDGNIGTDINLPNVLYFWLEGENIKSYIQDARKYRDYLKNNYILGKDLRFFKTSVDEAVDIKIRSQVPHPDKLFRKNLEHTAVDDKCASRFVDALQSNHYGLLINYFNCVAKFLEIFPGAEKDGFKKLNQNDKFAWIINIDTLEVMTQKEFIPNGFE